MGLLFWTRRVIMESMIDGITILEMMMLFTITMTTLAMTNSIEAKMIFFDFVQLFLKIPEGAKGKTT